MTFYKYKKDVRENQRGNQEVDNSETQATLDIQDTGWRQTKQKTQHKKKPKYEQRGLHQKSGVKQGVDEA